MAIMLEQWPNRMGYNALDTHSEITGEVWDDPFCSTIRIRVDLSDADRRFVELPRVVTVLGVDFNLNVEPAEAFREALRLVRRSA